MNKTLLSIFIVFVCLTLSSADCGCGTKCFAYSDPSRCTRCCTATVKRSLRHGPDGKPYSFDRNKSFLRSTPDSMFAYPKWVKTAADDRFLQKLSDILGLMDNPFL